MPRPASGKSNFWPPARPWELLAPKFLAMRARVASNSRGAGPAKFIHFWDNIWDRALLRSPVFSLDAPDFFHLQSLTVAREPYGLSRKRFEVKVLSTFSKVAGFLGGERLPVADMPRTDRGGAETQSPASSSLMNLTAGGGRLPVAIVLTRPSRQARPHSVILP